MVLIYSLHMYQECSVECGKEGGLFGDRRVKWLLMDLWTRGYLSHTAPSSSCQGSGEMGYWFGSCSPIRTCIPEHAPLSQPLQHKVWALGFISSFSQVPGSGAGSRMAPLCRSGCWIGRECSVRDSVPEPRTLHSCWEPGLPSEAVPAAAGVLRALVFIAHEWYTWSRHYSSLAIGTGISPVMPGLCPALQIYSLSSFTFSEIPRSNPLDARKGRKPVAGCLVSFSQIRS